VSSWECDPISDESMKTGEAAILTMQAFQPKIGATSIDFRRTGVYRGRRRRRLIEKDPL
jgi:hypothetical protein